MAPINEVDTQVVDYEGGGDSDEVAAAVNGGGQQQQQQHQRQPSKDIDEETSSTTSSEETLGGGEGEEDSGFNSSEEDAEEKRMMLQKSGLAEEMLVKGVVGELPRRSLADSLEQRLRPTSSSSCKPKRLEMDASACVVEPPFSLKCTVYLSYAVLILFGYIRIFLERCGAISQGMCKEKNREVS